MIVVVMIHMIALIKDCYMVLVMNAPLGGAYPLHIFLVLGSMSIIELLFNYFEVKVL